MTDAIFVQVASYRDPQLIPTLIDLIRRAAQPSALRTVVCWQHASRETIEDFLSNGFTLRDVHASRGCAIHRLSYRDAAVELIDVPHLKTQGVCWARNLIQQHYRGEKYTLQLDSHHRFIEDWDSILIDMLESLRDKSPKPILTAYLPAFDPDDDPASRVMAPTVLTFEKYNWEGILTMGARYIDQAEYAQPVRARFYSAHFAFADGALANEVQHDPQCFFTGEEITIAARAFTHGYDFYHPHRVVAWHQYSRPGCPKVWDDHTGAAKRGGEVDLDWSERNDRARIRNRYLLGIDRAKHSELDLGRYGFGKCRSLADYETYAGVLFAERAAHPAARAGFLPPDSDTPHATNAAGLDAFYRSNEVRICAPESALGDWTTALSAHLGFFDRDGVELYHEALDEAKLKSCVASRWLNYDCAFDTALRQIPVRYALELFDRAERSLARLERPVEA
jgi:Glycosyltransferase (GlcNAc)